jgi:tetratricopeptide (TPR) repeat protein
MRYKGTDKSVPDIGRELGADAVIEGSVRRVGGRIRVTAQLIHAASDAHLWGKDFDRDVSDVLVLQAEIANAIVREIQVQVTPDEAARLSAARPVHPEAYDAYLLGRYHHWQRNPASWKRSIAELEKAVRLQPDYAPAYAALAMAWAAGRGQTYTRDEGDRRSAVRRALEIDPSLADAHEALAEQRFDDWDWQGAIDAWETALVLNPDSIDTCGCYASALAAFGQFDKALRLVEHGVSVNPLAPHMRFQYGLVLSFARRYADAERQLQLALELEPTHAPARIFLAYTYFWMGRPEDALAQLDRPEFQASPFLATLYALLGRREDALTVLARTSPDDDPNTTAQVYFALGDVNRGFEWLTRSVDRRQGFARFLKVAPFYDRVRSDPRFAALVARLKLPA